ncbi:MAG: hypothetical protein LBH59_09990 [Planctomycetaceae bacterium]|nr:hypothetical protein [Planctomycetaceae bacterium]
MFKGEAYRPYRLRYTTKTSVTFYNKIYMYEIQIFENYVKMNFSTF